MTAQTLSDAERVIKFIQIYCKVPEGAKVGQPLELADFQLSSLSEIYTITPQALGGRLCLLPVKTVNPP